ncbi:MAG: UDP-glucose--hexose-1-phosphate uridylyltransferase [Spirochaetales bacterium]|uniref:Galactose-1-phosphate uridylyltransferase n=1 Tax=Candidatus Thalassospirochaeta sargassi TaxID=3119039 RepID=A0AAJ1IDY0_9SPIO|nr:UDP-glucose--hexose-1-phosphate uridylyltransferase [Spirochaetales bacterium]
MNFNEDPHRRLNILTGEWVKVSPHRTKRPWNGQVEKLPLDRLPEYDPGCYLCPGNTRSGGVENPDYEETFVFDNDFMAILPDTEADEYKNGLLRAKTEQGICRVICFSPRHDLTLALMEPDAVKKVVQLWIDQYEELGAIDFINHVQIFENRGAVMGCSNPHPHGQIWAEREIPTLPAVELERQKAHYSENGSCLLCDYLAQERSDGSRIIFENDSIAVLVPFWAVWPYEVMILPKRHMSSMSEMTESEKFDLAKAVRTLGIKYDNLFHTKFPYSMGIHQKPTDGGEYPEAHFHFHYYPPLLRSATVKKFMVGYEMLAMPQRDISAEQAAAALRALPEVHFSAEEEE